MIAGGKGKKSSSPRSEIPKLALCTNMTGEKISDLLYANEKTAKVDNSETGYEF
jgi:hypothetical protein